MDRNFARALPLVLKYEGGWSDDPHDKGGATMRGITLTTFRRYVKADATKDDLRRITDAQVSTVYYRHYWAAVNAAALPAGVDFATFDFAVNSGPDRAAKYLQAVVGAKQDGKIGPATVAAIQKMGSAAAINALCDKRLAFLKRLSTWKRYGRGWESRVAQVREAAIDMVGNSADVVTKTVPVEVEKPTVPQTVEVEVKKKTNLWGWLTTIFGSGGVGIAGFLGADWQTVVAIGGLAIVMLVIVILLRRQIIGAVEDIRAAVEA